MEHADGGQLPLLSRCRAEKDEPAEEEGEEEGGGGRGAHVEEHARLLRTASGNRRGQVRSFSLPPPVRTLRATFRRSGTPFQPFHSFALFSGPPPLLPTPRPPTMEMTPKSLKDICRNLKLYSTPYLNDKIYLHYKVCV